MATSKCPKCDSVSFETVAKSIDGSRFKVNFIQCSRCGSVVGVLEYYDIGYLIHRLAKELHVNIDN